MEPFAVLPQEVYGYARYLMYQGHSAEGACRQVYDNWMDSLLRDWGEQMDGINPDPDIRHEDWTQLATSHDPTTSYMHHAYRISEYMEDLTRKAWQEMGKSYHFTEAQVEEIMHHALGEGQHQEVLDMHNRMPLDERLDCVGAMMEPYRQHLESGMRAYAIHSQEIAKHLRDRNYSNQRIF